MIKVYAPASIGNVGVGFDALGAAIFPIDGTLLGDFVSVEPAPFFSLYNEGRFVKKLPLESKKNLVYQCWNRFCEAVGKKIPVTMRLEKNMPIRSGLGSSACSIVASMMAMNGYCNKPLNDDEMLLLMGEMEGRISGGVHFDNVAPCFLGGIRLILEENGRINQPIPCFDNWFWIIAYPGIEISTSEARAILPTHYLRQDCVNHSRYLAGFVHACHTRQPVLAATLMKDVIADPYRTPLLPKYAVARLAVMDLGALVCGISGSGPTLFAICDCQDIAMRIKKWFKLHYMQNEEGFVHICRLDTCGARVIME